MPLNAPLSSVWFFFPHDPFRDSTPSRGKPVKTPVKVHVPAKVNLESRLILFINAGDCSEPLFIE